MGEFFYPMIGWLVPVSTFLMDFPALVIAAAVIGCGVSYFGFMQKAGYAKHAGAARFIASTLLFLALSAVLIMSIFWFLGVWAALVGSSTDAMDSAMINSLAPLAALSFSVFFMWLVLDKYLDVANEAVANDSLSRS